LTSEPGARENLLREGVGAERIEFVGNVMIDTLVRYRDEAAKSGILERLGVAPGTYAALTLHRPSNVDDEGVLGILLEAIARIQTEIPVVFPVHPRTRRRLEALGPVLPRMPQLTLCDPLPYLDFVQLMSMAQCVLTDSGGIQEETTALGVPCLTLRPNTERPITVTLGTNRVVGTDPADIYQGWRSVADGRRARCRTCGTARRRSGWCAHSCGWSGNGMVDVQPLTVQGMEWDTFVRNTPGGSPFHLTAWKRVVETTFGQKPHYLMAVRGGAIEGVLPLFVVRGLLGGRGLVSVPYGVYGGICSASTAAAAALVAAATELAGKV